MSTDSSRLNKVYLMGGISLTPFIGLVLLPLLLAPSAQAKQPTNVSIQLSNGLIKSASINSASDKGIVWTARGTAKPSLMPYEQIAWIDFPKPDLWKQGNIHFHKGDYPKAIEAFTSLSNDPQGNFFPAPGNYTSLACLRLIDCFRETGDAKAVSTTAAKISVESLPKYEQSKMEVISAWVDLGEGRWEEALSKANTLASNPILTGQADLAYIKAVALEKLGRPEEAIAAYGAAYTGGFGASRQLSKRAVKNAILLHLELNNKSRESELHSLVHTYAKVYNNGKLWDGAAEQAVNLLRTKLELPKPAPAPEKPTTTAEESGPSPAGEGKELPVKGTE